MAKSGLKRAIPFLVSVLLQGCIPPPPAVVDDIDNLKREVESQRQTLKATAEGLAKKQEDIRARIEDLTKERGQIQQDIASIKKEVELQGKERASTASSIEQIKVEMGKLEGRFEEGRFEAQKAREALENLQSRTPDRKEVTTRFTEVQTTLEGLEKRITLETERARATEERITSLERQIAGDSERIKGLEERFTLLEKEGETKGVVKEETPPPNPEALYNEGLQLIRDKKDYDPGIKALRRFIELFPDHDLADNAQYWIGEGYYAQRDYERAILEFNEVMKRYPRGDKTPSATLKQALAFYELGKRSEARVLLERVKERYPATEEATIARKKLEEMR